MPRPWNGPCRRRPRSTPSKRCRVSDNNGSKGERIGRSTGLHDQGQAGLRTPADSDGQRILVDWVWPHGLTKEQLHLHRWAKELAPSAALRKWFGHDAARWDAFCARYHRELDAHPEAVKELVAECLNGPVTLVFGARDVDHNRAVALERYLRSRRKLVPKHHAFPAGLLLMRTRALTRAP
ncbi:DUF488 domain-containing protein [Methyloceanibacter stevinii]|uniref:DUF488 domain-containing protein n=1 Tax=Methyloceanibacter stevinii TaxID=1774970 RepID=UPI0031395DE5